MLNAPSQVHRAGAALSSLAHEPMASAEIGKWRQHWSSTLCRHLEENWKGRSAA